MKRGPLTRPFSVPPHHAVRLMAKRNLPTRTGSYDPRRYQGLPVGELARQLRNIHSGLLRRGQIRTLLARREIGGLLTEFARLHPRERSAFEFFAKRHVGLSYDEGRRHMQL